MPAINMSVEHGRTMPEARAALRAAVEQTTGRFGALVRRVEWTPAGDAVNVTGIGFAVEMVVDEKAVHVTGTLPGFGGLLGGPFATGLKQIVQKVFQQRLTGGR
jgi:hypothetical protein